MKLLVHFNMDLGEEFPIFDDWFKLYYIENAGMAFGLQIGFPFGKLLLSIFRIIATVAIGWYLYYMTKKQAHQGLLWCMALILGGAIGNVIDSIFYGFFLDNASPDSITLWFHGKVIDMFYVDIWDFVPDWIPIFGGVYYPLWPIFNIADAAIFIAVVIILIMQKRFLN